MHTASATASRNVWQDTKVRDAALLAMHMRQSIKRNTMFSDCSIRAPLRSTCLLMALHQDTLLPFAGITKSQGMLHMLPDTEIPGSSTEDLLSV